MFSHGSVVGRYHVTFESKTMEVKLLDGFWILGRWRNVAEKRGKEAD